MTDIFKAIADPKARLLLETLAKKPESTVAKLAEYSKLTSAQVSKIIASLVEAKLVKSTGSSASKKYSLNGKGFSPYLSWLAKVAETQTVANLELQLNELGEKLGNVIAQGSVWIGDKVRNNIDVDPKKRAKELGRILAEVKTEVKKEVKAVQKEAKSAVAEVKRRVKR